MRSVLSGTLTVTISPDGFTYHEVSRAVHLMLDFSEQGRLVALVTGWPTMLFDNSAPLSPATRSLRVSLSSSFPGFVDLWGHMDLPIVLHLDYEPNFIFGKVDLDIFLMLTTRPNNRIWEQAPKIRLSAIVSYPPSHKLTINLSGIVNPPPAPYPSSETVWFDGALPDGAIPQAHNEPLPPFVFKPYNFYPPPVAPPLPPGYTPLSPDGRVNQLLIHGSDPMESGTSQHFFDGAAQTLAVAQGERLFAYVYHRDLVRPYLDEIMLQWNDGTWEHRAFWGADIIPYGVTGTVSRRRIGELPPANVWTRLEVLASDVGLEERTLNGMAFTVNTRGHIYCDWSRAGKLHDPNQ